MNFKLGKEYQCIISKSVAYKVGHVYKTYKNEAGNLCLRGEDGLEDLCSMLVSEFVKVESDD